jgi:hypothetical protein
MSAGVVNPRGRVDDERRGSKVPVTSPTESDFTGHDPADRTVDVLELEVENRSGLSLC